MQPPDSSTPSDRFVADSLVNNSDETNLWHSTFNAIEDAVCIIDNQQRIVRCNRAMQKFTGNNDGNLIGKHCFEVVHGIEHPLTECPINKMRQTHQRESSELKMGEKWFEVTVDPLFGPDKQLSGAVHIVRDITTRKQAIEKIKESEQGIRKKLEAVLSPDGDIGKLELADIIDAQAIQAVMDDFYSITHIGVGIIDMKGKVLVANGWQEVCTCFHRTHPDTCRNCIESDTILSLQEPGNIGKVKAYKCKNNMWDLSTPIVVGGKHLGNIFLGQFFYDDEKPDYETFRVLARKYGFNEEEYIAALDRVPRWTDETVKNVMCFHSRLSLLISNMSYTNLKLAQTIEERNKATEELKSNYSLLHMAGETAKFGGWSVDLAKNKATWSEEVAAIHEEPAGYSPSVEQGISYYAPEWRDKISRVFTDCAAKGIPYDEEMEIITARNNRIWVRAVGEAVRDKNGKIVKVQGAFQDINRQKKSEQALVESEARLQELNATKDKFFSIIAHDLKSPFNSVIGFSDLLTKKIEEKDFEGVEKYAGIIQNSSQQAMDLLMNLLEWSRSQTGRMVFTPEHVDLVDLMNQSTELFIGAAEQKSISIATEAPSVLRAFADKTMMSTILRNLISNAIKFTHPGGRIVISAQQLPDELIIGVSDNGVGITKDTIDHLFQIDQSHSTLGTNNEKGTGLGLILCKEFIEKHGGRIWVESKVGKGSNFQFSIPRAKISDAAL